MTAPTEKITDETRVKELTEKLKVAEEALSGISTLYKEDEALGRATAEIIADEALKKLKGWN